MEEFKRIGYKSSYSTWVLLIGSVISFILMIFALVAKPDNFIIFVALCLLLVIVFFISFIIEKKRPDVVVFLSNNSVKMLKGFTWKIILFDDIDYVDYKLDVLKKTQAILFGAGSLIIENKTQKFVVRNIESVRDCYEEIIEAIKEYKNTEEKEMGRKYL